MTREDLLDLAKMATAKESPTLCINEVPALVAEVLALRAEVLNLHERLAKAGEERES